MCKIIDLMAPILCEEDSRHTAGPSDAPVAELPLLYPLDKCMPVGPQPEPGPDEQDE